MIISSGTLVVAIPYQAGIVFAADSRLTTNGQFCDGVDKIIIPNSPPRTTIAVTGNGLFRPEAPKSISDICSYIKKTKPLLDISAVVKSYIEAHSPVINTFDINALIDVCLKEVRSLAAEAINFFSLFDTPDICRVVLGQYDTSNQSSVIRTFLLYIDGNIIKAEAGMSEKFSVTKPKGIYWFGEDQYFLKHVFDIKGQGRKFVDRSLWNSFALQSTIGEITEDTAVRLAVNLVDATSKFAGIMPPKTGIGGPSKYMIVNQSPAPSRG